MTAGYSSFGTLLKLGDGGGPETFTTIAEVRDIQGPSLTLNTEDATNHSSAGGWEEKIATTLAGGQVKFECNFIPGHATHSQAAGFIKDLKNKTLRNFQLVFPSATTWTLAAYVASVEPKAPVKGILRADVTLEITGQPTLA